MLSWGSRGTGIRCICLIRVQILKLAHFDLIGIARHRKDIKSGPWKYFLPLSVVLFHCHSLPSWYNRLYCGSMLNNLCVINIIRWVLIWDTLTGAGGLLPILYLCISVTCPIRVDPQEICWMGVRPMIGVVIEDISLRYFCALGRTLIDQYFKLYPPKGNRLAPVRNRYWEVLPRKKKRGGGLNLR